MLTTGYTPIFQVIKDGKDITSQLQDRLVEVEIEQTEFSEIGHVQFVFDDRDWALQLPQAKDKISFLMGYKETGLVGFGEFEIDEIHLFGPPRSIKIVGHGLPLNSDLKVPKTNSSTNTTVGEVINKIASDAGVKANIDNSIASVKLPSFNQNNQSGFHIIDLLSRTYGGVAVYGNGMITIVKRGASSTVSGQSTNTFDLNPEEFGEWDIFINERVAFSGVQAAWYDKDNVTRKFEQSTSSGAVSGNFPLSLDFSGAQNPSRFLTLPGLFQTQEQARTAAQAKMSILSQLKSQATITLAKGEPAISVHNHITISGMRDGIDGEYIVQNVKHSYKKSTGIVTTIMATSLPMG